MSRRIYETFDHSPRCRYHLLLLIGPTVTGTTRDGCCLEKNSRHFFVIFNLRNSQAFPYFLSSGTCIDNFRKSHNNHSILLDSYNNIFCFGSIAAKIADSRMNSNSTKTTTYAVLLFVALAVFHLLFDQEKYFDSLLAGAGDFVKKDEYKHEIDIDYISMSSKKIVADWIVKAPELARATANHTTKILPSKEDPLLYFHMRKAGGSRLRKLLFSASKANRLKPWIACEGGTSCVPYSRPPTNAAYEIYAGHINYVEMEQLLSETGLQYRLVAGNKRLHETYVSATQRESGNTTKENNRKDNINGNNLVFYSAANEKEFRRTRGICLTNVREPVSRTASCWNYRMHTTHKWPLKLPLAHNMTAAEWNDLLPKAVDEYGNGCCNEMHRIFGSSGSYDPASNTLGFASGKHFSVELEEVLDRMSNCIVLDITKRCGDSNLILRHYLPWLGEIDLCDKPEKTSSLPGANALSVDAREAIAGRNQLDVLAYEFGNELFREQLKIALEGRG